MKVPQKTLKVELRHVGELPHEQLPCWQREKIEGIVCSLPVQLGGWIRKVQSEGNSQCPFSAGRVVETMQNEECRTLSTARSMG